MTTLPTTIGRVFIQTHAVAIENVQERDVAPHDGQTCSAIWWRDPLRDYKEATTKSESNDRSEPSDTS